MENLKRILILWTGGLIFLTANAAAIAFYKAAGYAEYSLCLEMPPGN